MRRSSVQQSDNHSFDIQRSVILNKASQLDLHFEGEALFSDDATSAFKQTASERKALKQLKRFILKHRVPCLIVYDTSRLDRTIYSFVLEFYQPIKKEIPEFKIYEAISDKEWNPNRLEVKWSLLQSSNESAEKSRRATDAQSMLLDRNQRPGSSIPYGYRSEMKAT